MPRKKATPTPTLSDQIRSAIRSSGESPYRIEQATGVGRFTIHRFLNGEGLTIPNLDRLAAAFDLRIVQEEKTASA